MVPLMIEQAGCVIGVGANGLPCMRDLGPGGVLPTAGWGRV